MKAKLNASCSSLGRDWNRFLEQRSHCLVFPTVRITKDWCKGVEKLDMNECLRFYPEPHFRIPMSMRWDAFGWTPQTGRSNSSSSCWELIVGYPWRSR